MLHKWHLDASSTAIFFGKYRNRCIQIYFHLANEYCHTTSTSDVWLSNSMAQPLKLRCCVFNKVFLENYWQDTVNYS